MPSMDAMLQEQRRKQAQDNLAQAMLGSRSRTPANAPRPQGLGASLASRVGVQRRPAPAPRTNSAPPPRAPRQPRQPPQVANNSAPRRPRETATEQYSAPRDNTTDLFPQQQQSSARPANTNVKSNGRSAAREPAVNSYNVRGAAKSEQNVVVGENFVVGTSAADIEVVMLDVGGAMNSCEVVATRPAVTVEMSFVDRQGGQAVIDTFDGKKADSNTLRVYWKGTQYRAPSPAAVGFVVDTQPTADDSMDIDEHTRDREEQNRLREERRGAAPRGPASEPQRDSRDRGRNGGYPSGPSVDRRGHYDNRNIYNDRRYSNGGGGGGGRHYNGGGGRQYPRGQGYQS